MCSSDLTESALNRRAEIVNDGYRLSPLLVQGWSSFKLDEEDLRSFIKNITCPVLFTWAMKDKFVQFGRNKNSIKQFHNYTLLEYPIGHTPYLEMPEKFNDDFIEWLNSMK